MELKDILLVALKSGASDIHIKAGLPPMFRVKGSLVPLKDAQRLQPEDTARLAATMMNREQLEHFQKHHELDLSYGLQGVGRFRANIFRQRTFVGIVLRVIAYNIPSIETLHLPPAVIDLAKSHRGLVLVTGATGSGKSTTLAAMLDYINTNNAYHILTVEDPIEFMHRDKRSVINQREVGMDTNSFGAALKSALRQDPDVILVGEMRDVETIEIALKAAETGHLVFSTLHTVDGPETINRIVGTFPPHQQEQIRHQLASVLVGVISQRLVPRSDGKGRVPAVEIMVNKGRVQELLEDRERLKELHDAMAKGGSSYGMQTFNQSLYQHYQDGLVSFEDAQKYASNPDDFALLVSGISGTGDWEPDEDQDEMGSSFSLA